MPMPSHVEEELNQGGATYSLARDDDGVDNQRALAGAAVDSKPRQNNSDDDKDHNISNDDQDCNNEIIPDQTTTKYPDVDPQSLAGAALNRRLANHIDDGSSPVWDAVTGERLPHDLTTAARQEEI